MRLSLLLAATLAGYATAFPAYLASTGDDARLSARASIPDSWSPAARAEQAERIRRAALEPRAGPVQVPDEAHPYRAPGAGDKRGPCPGLNTLANHGYLPRSGIVHAQDIIEGALAGLGMSNDVGAVLAAYGVLSEGDVTSNMLSIGALGTSKGLGLSNHGAFEGDASLSRKDAFFGDGQFSGSAFDAQQYAEFKDFNARFGDGRATFKSLAEYRYKRFQDSVADNPDFTFLLPRYLFSYGEAALVLRLFANHKDGADGSVSAADLDSFFIENRFPADWYRRGGYTFPEIFTDTLSVLAPHFVAPGLNAGAGNYLPTSPSPTLDALTPAVLGCALYNGLVSALPSSLLGPTGTLLGGVSGLLGQLYGPLGEAFACPRSSLGKVAAGQPAWVGAAIAKQK